MIAVAVAVIALVVAVTCGIVADSNHADSLAFLGVMVKTTAAQIFLTGAICTWALFAALWLLSVGLRRSRERTLELRALRAGPAGLHLAYTDAEDDRLLTAPGSASVGGAASVRAARSGLGASAAGLGAPPTTRATAPPRLPAPLPPSAPLPPLPPLSPLPPLTGDEPTLTEDGFADDSRDPYRGPRLR